MRLLVASTVLLIAGCSANRNDSTLPSPVGVTAPEEIMAALQTGGPDHFAMVNPSLYRGGAPSVDDLEYLRALGVTKIVDLRRESLGKRRAEAAEARRLGLEYVEYPFYGRFGTDMEFIDKLMAELDTDNRGAVYVHCKTGRDRTSLAIALYRVAHDGWSADLAWEREALAYGHESSIWNRELELTFQDYAHEEMARRQTVSGSRARVRAVSAAFGGPANGALVHGGSDQRTAAP